MGYILCSCFRLLGSWVNRLTFRYHFSYISDSWIFIWHSANDLEKVHLLSREESQNECSSRGSPSEETVAAIDTQLTHLLCPKGPRLIPWGFIQPYKLTDVQGNLILHPATDALYLNRRTMGCIGHVWIWLYQPPHCTSTAALSASTSSI